MTTKLLKTISSLKKALLKLYHKLAAIFTYLSNIGTKGIEDDVLVANIKVTNTLSITFGIIILFIAPVVYWIIRALALPIIAEFFINASVLLLNHYKKHIAASMLLFFLQAAAITYFSLLLGEVLHMQFMVTFLISIIYLIFSKNLHRKFAFGISVAVLTIVQVCYFFNIFEPIPISYDAGFTIQCLVIIGILIILGLVSKPYVASNDWIHKIRKANHFIKIFTSQIVHELRNHLNSVNYISQCMKMEIKLDSNLKKMTPYVDKLYTVVASMSNIINNVLEMARIEAGKMEELKEEHFLVKDFFEQIISTHKIPAKARNLQLNLSIDQDMPEVIISDPLQLHQITTNLLVNAVKYALIKTVITLKISRQDDEWHLCVINKGVIIPLEKQAVLFKQFETNKTNRFTEGTGIGLSIVKRKIEALNGSIGMESKDDGDIIFMAKFKLREGNKEDIAKETEMALDLSDVHILVVDDDEMGRTLIANFFSLSGCSVTTAGNGHEAVVKLEQARQLPDAIIMDHHMPEMDGLQALTYLKKDPLLQHIPVIICTGDPLYIDTLKAAGAIDVLIKPVINVRPILTIISQHLPRVYEI